MRCRNAADAEDAAAQQHQLLVVARDALEHPQQARVIAPIEAIRHERGGFRALHVPGMKVLVARERKKALVVARLARLADLRQIVAAEDEARRGAMLETAVAVGDGQAEKPIAIERRGRAEELDLRRAELAQVHGDALEVRLEPARDDEVVRHAAGLELDALEVADLDGMVEQLVVVLRVVGAEAALVDLAGARARLRRASPRTTECGGGSSVTSIGSASRPSGSANTHGPLK